MLIMYQKRLGGVTCFNLATLETEGKQFKRLDREYGHTKDLIYALDNELEVILLDC